MTTKTEKQRSTKQAKAKQAKTPRAKSAKYGVTADEFRRVALSLPETEEKSHMNHPDFRVRGKVFATLQYPDKSSGMVKLDPETQEMFVSEDPEAFKPCNGAWGAQGATNVRLAAVHPATLEEALLQAWRKALPKGNAVMPGSVGTRKPAEQKNGKH